MKNRNWQDWLRGEKKGRKKKLRMKWTIPFLLYASLTFTYKKGWTTSVGADEEGLQCEEMAVF
jgi:hypothetical protein